MATIRQIEEDPSNTWDDLSWTDMNGAEQKLWAVLGWDASSWEEETDAPDSSEEYWEDLTDEQRDAAQQLGYTQELWDEE